MLDKFIISCTRKLIGSSDKKRKKTQKPLDGVDVARDIMTENEPVFYDVYRDRARQGALPSFSTFTGAAGCTATRRSTTCT